MLRDLLHSGDKHYRLTAEKKSYPVSDTPAWTVKTHTLPVPHSELSLHYGTGDDIVVFDKSPGINTGEYFQSQYTYLASLPSKPRDPPVI